MVIPARVQEACRQTPESQSTESDYRSEFEHDRARIIHSAAFRRLQGKTQVFGVYEGDFFRTRLTHSLEVAQIAKGIALRLGADTDLVEAVCLAHDLGHPPFGHTGEHTLHELMRYHGGFEGNAQTFRILTCLERKHVAYDGLNLTYQTLDGVLKYKTCIDAAALAVSDDPVKGFYAWDRGLVAAIVHYTGSGYARSFECQIMDVADDIAYSVHDLEDSLKAGLISLSDFHRAPPPRVVQAVNAKLAPLGHTVSEGTVRRELVCMAKRLEELERTAGRVARKMLTRDLIHEFASAVALQPDGRVDAELVSRVRIEVLKAFESYKVIFNPRVTTLGHKGKEVLRRLFAVLDQGRESIGLFPEDHGEDYERALMDGDETARKRVICDFLAGMTDSYAMRFYSRLFVPGEGSFYEML
ncbi:MAG TPA: dNTP triphosphohydrolase [Candidatus Binatia bacterium]|nr:dNTP triphosphohydrolase [Candidatus Binatia bacterium]